MDTFVINESYRERLYGFIRRQVQEGGQVYIVCPAVEEGEENEETSRVIPAGQRNNTLSRFAGRVVIGACCLQRHGHAQQNDQHKGGNSGKLF